MSEEKGDIPSLYNILTTAIDEKDKAYQMRWEASEKAVSAALVAQEKAVAAALSATEKAVSKAELANEKRFESINERLDDLRGYKDQSAGKSSGLNAGWAIFISIVSLLTNLVGKFFK